MESGEREGVRKGGRMEGRKGEKEKKDRKERRKKQIREVQRKVKVMIERGGVCYRAD